MTEPVIPERYKPLLEERRLFCLRDILVELGAAEMYKIAFETAREQILHTVGPMEVNDVLTIMDEACEYAAMGNKP